MKYFIPVIICLVLTGCGHNSLQYLNGKYANFGVDPSTAKLGIQYGTGDVVSIVQKDNSQFELETTDNLNGQGKVTSRITKIKYKIGEQATGGDSDLQKAKK